MITAIIILLFIDVVFIIWAVYTTPFGYEDENGWHKGKPHYDCGTENEERKVIKAERKEH